MFKRFNFSKRAEILAICSDTVIEMNVIFLKVKFKIYWTEESMSLQMLYHYMEIKEKRCAVH